MNDFQININIIIQNCLGVKRTLERNSNGSEFTEFAIRSLENNLAVLRRIHRIAASFD